MGEPDRASRQLLAYAGKGRIYIERVNLSEAVVQTSKLIHSSIGDGVQLRLDLDKDIPLLLADPGQVQQIVMNLIINAAEAVDNTGGVLVRTGRQTVSEPLPDLYLNEPLPMGNYVFLEVMDNGSGMDEQTIRRIFDPFFTTKFTGRGLGLAAVLGIIRQHKGGIQVHSVPGRGSSFRVLLPVTDTAPSQITADAPYEELKGTGTVLAIDDEQVIRSFTKLALIPFGYDVLLAGSGEEGVRLFEERSAEIALILLDVSMPGMDGVETMDRIKGIRLEVPVVVCSGLGAVDVKARFAGRDVAGFLTKPYTAKQLAKAVKEHMPGKCKTRHL